LLTVVKFFLHVFKTCVQSVDVRLFVVDFATGLAEVGFTKPRFGVHS